MARSPIAAALAVLVATAGLSAAAGAGAEPAGAGGQQRPNIVLVVTDDQTMAQLSTATMPTTLGLIGDQGTTFANNIAVTPLCCPSRAAMITGQYGHNNGVLANAHGYQSLRDKPNTLASWLRGAGYTTAHVGRWLNAYKQHGGDRPAPGWDEWFTMVGESRKYFDYTLFDGRRPLHFGNGSRDYLTRVLNQRAVRLIRANVPKRRPFYLQLDQLAPHSDAVVGGSSGPCAHSAIPPTRAPVGFEDAPLPMPPSFDEPDVSDKPSFIKLAPTFSDQQIAELERQYRCRLASLPAVDEGVRRIVEALDAAGELDTTAIVFTSDNGFFFGEHRVPTEKYLPYEEDIHMPLLIRFPASVAPPGGVVSQPVANIDIAPTLLELAGAAPCVRGRCRTLDGRSLVALAAGDSSGWPQDRALLLELRRQTERPNVTRPCAYSGVRVDGQIYVEYSSVPGPTGECQPAAEVEHYDLGSDPFELDNLFPAPAGSAAAQAEFDLAQRVAALSDCAGIEGRDPAPPSGHYCE